MQWNESILDRMIRIAGGLFVLSLSLVGPQSIWGLLGIIPLVSGLSGFDPLYGMLKFATTRRPSGSWAARRSGGVVAAIAVLVTGLSAQAQPAPAARTVAYDAEFSRRFPVVAGAHRVDDWQLYTALVSGDVVGYAARMDPQVARSFEQMLGKGYQTQQLQEQIRQDRGLLAAFSEHRERLATMTVFADGGNPDSRSCRHPVVYVAREFRLVLGESRSGENPLVTSTVAPSCSQVGESAVQITAGRSPRFSCWTIEQVTSCGWRLPDMPVDLKRIIENDYPQSIHARWRWRGLGGVTRVHYPGVYGSRSVNDSVALTVPVGLALEFIDGAGQVRWTANSAGWNASAASREGQR